MNPFSEIVMRKTLICFAIVVSAIASNATGAEAITAVFPSFETIRASRLALPLLPGQQTFTFTLYGAPADTNALRELVGAMKRESLGNGFDPGPGLTPLHQDTFDFLRELGWPVIPYAQTADHQVKEGTCRLTDEQDAMLRRLESAGIFAATQLGEWGYYFHNLSHQESWWRAVYGEDFEKQNHLMKPAGLSGYDRMPVSRLECYQILKDYFDTRQHQMRGWNISVTGHSHYEAYAGQWGARLIGLEVGENIAFTQSKFAFARGAARRNRKPWSVQVSPWFSGSRTSSGPLVLQPDGHARGLDAGHSLSLYQRMWLHAWFAGAAMVTPEASSSIFFERLTPPFHLTEHGWKASQLFRFMQSKDRGVPYTPIAILLDQYAGYNAYMGKPWGILKPTAGDTEIDTLFTQQLFPGSDHIHKRPFPENPEASYLRPTPFGEIFDVQLSDADADVLAAYPVLVLVGDHTLEEPFVDALLHAIEHGSHLLISRKHAEAIQSSRLGQRLEQNRVEVLEPWIHPVTQKPTAISDARLRRLCKDYLPVAVVGDAIQYQVNRTSTGWVIELVNNRGVVKFPRQPAVVDASEIASVTLQPSIPHQGLFDWRTGEPLLLHDGRCTIAVGPGETEFIEIATEATR
jgi:hypothetical protein